MLSKIVQASVGRLVQVSLFACEVEQVVDLRQ
jgi:hypothetical protein